MKNFGIFKLVLVLMFVFLPYSALGQSESVSESVKYIPLPNPLGGLIGNVPTGSGSTESFVVAVIGRIIQALLGLLGVAGLVVLITGGIVWLTSGGNDDKIKKGRDIIAGAVLGLLVVFGGYFLVELVIKAILI